jgi:hypothetical protein
VQDSAFSWLFGWLVGLVISALEDGDSMFLRNVGIYQHINTAPNPKIKKKHDNNRREKLKSQHFQNPKFSPGLLMQPNACINTTTNKEPPA